MRVGSLFSGIGGLELGLERAGMEVVWQVERDAYCRRVLAKHWPDVTRYEDVHDVGRSNLASVDLICGGFPCQDISAAGNGAGIIKGNRSGLWYEFARIIRELRPRYVVVENVPAITSRGLGIVLGDLADAGYDAEWGCVSAAAVGAPHLRKRIFIVAHTESAGREARGGDGLGDADGSRGDQGLATGPCEEVGRWWAVEPDLGRVAHGVPARVDRLRALGNAVVPQVAKWIGQRIQQEGT